MRQGRLGASASGGGQASVPRARVHQPPPITKGTYTIWPRKMQELVDEQLFGIRQKEEGKHYVPLILTASPSGNTPAQLHKKL